MALKESVTVDKDDIAGHDGDVDSAMKLWLGIHGPVHYNQWQSLYFGLIRDFQLEDRLKPDGETRGQLQLRLRQLHRERHVEIHGESWQTELSEKTAALMSQPDEA